MMQAHACKMHWHLDLNACQHAQNGACCQQSRHCTKPGQDWLRAVHGVMLLCGKLQEGAAEVVLADRDGAFSLISDALILVSRANVGVDILGVVGKMWLGLYRAGSSKQHVA